MKRIAVLFSLLLALLAPVPASAQMTMSGVGGGFGVAGAGFTGPIDINGAAYAFWSTRCGSTSYTGNVIDIVDASTGTTTGTRLHCSSGGVISALVSGSACTFVTGNACSALATTCATACVAKTIYDQAATNCTTACNQTSISLAKSPVITTSCANGLMCLTFTNPMCMVSPNISATGAQPFTISFVTNNTNNGLFVSMWSANTGAAIAAGTNGTNTGWMFAGSTTATIAVSENAIHASQQLYSAASSSWYLDGTANTGLVVGSTSIATASPFSLGQDPGCSFGGWDGKFFELGIWAGDKTANNATVNGNQHTYWAF